MGRWSQYDEDNYRRPEGMKRVGYDKDSRKYFFRDEQSQLWEGPEGARFGEITRVSHAAEVAHGDELLRPDTMTSCLRGSAPEIWQPSCDISPTSHSDKGKGKSKSEALSHIKVAASSKFDMADELGPEPAIAPNMMQDSHRGHRKTRVPSLDVIPTGFLSVVGMGSPSSQEKQGDEHLNQARDLLSSEVTVQSMIEETEIRVIEEKIAYAQEMKVALNNKSGVQKWLLAQKYNKFAQRVYLDVKSKLNRAKDQFQSQADTALQDDPLYDHTAAITGPGRLSIDALDAASHNENRVARGDVKENTHGSTVGKVDTADDIKAVVSSEMTWRESTILAKETNEAPQTA